MNVVVHRSIRSVVSKAKPAADYCTRDMALKKAARSASRTAANTLNMIVSLRYENRDPPPSNG